MILHIQELTMKKILACALVLVMSSIGLAQAEERPVIDVVFCIDCSGSMGPVIEAAKIKVWAVINEMARVKPAPVLRIGLVGYGNGQGPFRTFDLTDDLDTVYKDLMTFKDEGWGAEFVGLAIDRATKDLKWSEGEKVLRVIYVLGNETARQGPVDYTVSAPAAIAKGIIINPIYCGKTQYESATPTWREIAKLADGQYMEIAEGGGLIAINTPFDEELVKLNEKLNATYLAYGAHGTAGAANQVAQDGNASTLGTAVLADRALAKCEVFYCNSRWDLVDACAKADFDLSKVKDEDLPESVRKLAPEKRLEFVQAVGKQRADVQAQIKSVAEKRAVLIKEEIEKQGLAADKAMDEQIKRSIIEQARKRGLTVEG
jgi:hypothetical protein